ncbi:MAG: hypothetical protein K0U52_00235 [Gammaproteobacteria bacterium]|nr:hypothetical protein [Gammaproteobacteria bacterium]
MAHFAELNQDNIVQRVIVVNNEVITNNNNEEQESLGIDFCKSLFGNETNWAQTSYNGSFRKRFAAKDYTFDILRDAFIPPKPFESWILNESTCSWEAPVTYPTDGNQYEWNEESETWHLTT